MARVISGFAVEQQDKRRVQASTRRPKLHGRAFYESIGSPKIVLAPMVEQSEFAWRMLSRSFLPPSRQSTLLAYTPMFHSRLFREKIAYREAHFQPLTSGIPSPSHDHDDNVSPVLEEKRYLDGNPALDRPLTVQFCSNDPDDLLAAAKYVAPFCDAVDLNLGCPQGIAKKGRYGAFLQEQPDLIANMVRKLHEELDIPVTAKMRILDTQEQTLRYAKMILDAGASIITVHGRRREQKGHNTGLADWSVIRYLREHLPRDTVIFANGNILQYEDIQACLEATGADAVMSAEGNLYDPTIFASPPPLDQEVREYWRGRDGKGGYRVDAVMRRYMNIIHQYVLDQPPPERRPLWMPGDPEEAPGQGVEPLEEEEEQEEEGPPRKKRRQASKNEGKRERTTNPNLTAMQAHLFHLLRPLVSQHHNVRDALARSRTGHIDAFEHVLTLVEQAVKQGITEYEAEQGKNMEPTSAPLAAEKDFGAAEDPSAMAVEHADPHQSSLATVAKCKRPFWVCQPYVRPLPKEAFERGSMTVSKKEMRKKRLEEEGQVKQVKQVDQHTQRDGNKGHQTRSQSIGQNAEEVVEEKTKEEWVSG